MDMENVIKNNRYEVLTPSGFQDFDGLVEQKEQNVLRIETKSSFLELTEEHKVFIDLNTSIEAKKLKVNQKLFSEGKTESIKKIKKLKNKKKVYDLLNVNNGNKFFANKILVSNCLYLDEFAFVPSNIASDFMSSVYPTITSGKTSKVIILSTPNGMNYYYQIWDKAVKGNNNYFPVKIHWWEHPDRDIEFKKSIIRDLGVVTWNAEYNCISKENLININNNKTNEQKIVSIGDLYEKGLKIFN